MRESTKHFMPMKRMLLFGSFLLVLTLALGGPAQAQTIKIGFIMPLTGVLGHYGEAVRSGFEFAISEANAKGGILGKTIVPVIADDKNDPAEASAVGNRLIREEGVKLIVGSITSQCAIPISEVCQREGVVFIAAYASNPKVTVAEGKRKTFVFRACFVDTFQGLVLARFVAKDLQKKTAAVLYDGGNPYSEGLAEFFRDAFRKEGGTIEAFASYRLKDVDFSPQLAQVAAAKPEVLFLPDHGHRVGLVAKQAREKDIQSILLGGDAWDTAVIYEIAGSAVDGSFYSTHFALEDQRPELQSFIEKYRARFDSASDLEVWGAVVGYDPTVLLLNAIEKAKSVDPRRVAEALAKTKDFPGVTGPITIDRNGDAIKSVVIYEIVNGKDKLKKTVSP